MNLSELKSGSKGIITKVKGHGSFQKRIMEMGFIKGREVEVIKNAPFSGPIEYNVMGYHVSLRINEARLIEVVAPEMAVNLPEHQYQGIIDDETLKITAIQQHKKISVAFVGNPNCGKTSLFNFTSGSKEHVGNYGGVTVEAKEAGYSQSDYQFVLNDLPGTYSLTAYTPEELYVRRFIFQNNPDIVVNVIDATNLERNLYLTTQLIDMDIKVVIALNMYDDLEKSGTHLKIDVLGKLLGIPIIPTVATKGKGVKQLFDKIIDVYENLDPIVRHIHINYGRDVEQAIRAIQDEIRQDKRLSVKMSPRFLAIKLLEQDKHAIRFVTKHETDRPVLKTSYHEVSKIESLYGESSEAVITDAKYGFIQGALKETLIEGRMPRREHSNAIDRILTHPMFGGPILLVFMFLMFFATFQLGSYPMHWIDSAIHFMNQFLKIHLPVGMFNDLLTDGIISGVGSVLVFLPNILILFLFISFMEDTGYMARAAFMMDKLMHKIGLHGRSFIPLIMGFGCNVPAILATRTIRNRNDRLLTMLITPFMSCSARLPVYVLLISAFFPSHQGSMLFLIYVIGVILAVLVGLTLKQTLFSKKDVPFVMELPPYRIPTLKSTTIHMWNKAVQYLKKMGSVILIASILIWALGYFPKKVDYSQNYEKLINQTQQNSQLSESVKADKIKDFELLKESEHQEKSYIGQLGHWIEPMIKPLGFDWKIGVSILTGMAAKEIVVSTMGVLYQVNPGDDQSQSLVTKLQQQTHVGGELHGKKVFSQLTAFTMMLFVLIYFPCIAVIAAIRKESNWKWAVFTMFYTTAMAWIIAFITYQAGSLLL